MPGLMDFMNTPEFAMAAGLLAPTPTGSFGGGLLQGLNAAQSSQQNNQAAQIQKMNIEQAQQKATERKAFQSMLESQYPQLSGISDPNQLNALANYMGTMDEGKPSGFEGTSMDAQASNVYVSTQRKIDQGIELTPEEGYLRDMSIRYLTAPKTVGNPETGFGQVPAPPLPGSRIQGGQPGLQQSAQSNQQSVQPRQGGRSIQPSFRVPLKDLSALKDENGKSPPPGTTYADVMNPDSGYKAMTAQEASKMLESESALGLLDELRELSGIGDPENSVFRKWDGFGERLAVSAGNVKDYLGGTDKKSSALRIYRDQRQAVLSMFVRALGEKGTLATKDISRIDRGLPTVFPLPDSPEDAKAKFDSLERMFRTIAGQMESGTYDEENGLGDNWDAISTGVPTVKAIRRK